MQSWIFMFAIFKFVVVNSNEFTEPILDLCGEWNQIFGLVEHFKTGISVHPILKHNETRVNRLVIKRLLVIPLQHLHFLLNVVFTDALQLWIFVFKHLNCHVIGQRYLWFLLLLLEIHLVVKVSFLAFELLLHVLSDDAKHFYWVRV